MKMQGPRFAAVRQSCARRLAALGNVVKSTPDPGKPY